MIFVNNANNTVSCKQIKEIQTSKNRTKNKRIKNENVEIIKDMFDSLQGKWIDTPIFKDEERTTLVQGICSYKINKDEKYIDVELRGIINSDGLGIRLVPVIADTEQSQVILQKEGNNYKARVDLPDMYGKILFKFYYMNPTGRDSGSDYQFKVGVVDVFYLQNMDPEQLSNG